MPEAFALRAANPQHSRAMQSKSRAQNPLPRDWECEGETVSIIFLEIDLTKEEEDWKNSTIETSKGPRLGTSADERNLLPTAGLMELVAWPINGGILWQPQQVSGIEAVHELNAGDIVARLQGRHGSIELMGSLHE